MTVRFKNGEVEAKAWDGDILHRLAELEDKIENGTLVELPCKVGDTVYGVSKTLSRVIHGTARVITINRRGIVITVDEEQTDCEYWIDYVFKTQSGAEAKLKELRGGMMKMNKAISLRVLDVPLNKTERDEFSEMLWKHILEIENKGNIAEIHYSIALNEKQYVYSAIIIEREGKSIR